MATVPDAAKSDRASGEADCCGCHTHAPVDSSPPPAGPAVYRIATMDCPSEEGEIRQSIEAHVPSS